MEWMPAIVAYVVTLGIHALMNRSELRDPEKAKRYQVLPIHYKLACWCGILPMLFAVPLALVFALDCEQLACALMPPFLGLVAYAALEIACVPIYRKHGLWK
jgi:hypothetical protein